MTEPRHRHNADFDPPLADRANVYRRRIVVTAVDSTTVRSVLEDDFHHFDVTLRHDGRRIVEVTNDSHRYPWATCPTAAVNLAQLVGADLSARFTHAAKVASAQHNCTHQFDAAAHAITAAATGRHYRQYDCEIASLLTAPPGEHRNRVWVDGVLVHDWGINAGRGPTTLPEPFDRAPWKGGFMRGVDAHLDPDTAEIAIVLRRASDIGMGRGMPLDAIPVASDLLTTMQGVCHSMQPDIATAGTRNVGSIRDFATHPEVLATDPTRARTTVLRH